MSHTHFAYFSILLHNSFKPTDGQVSQLPHRHLKILGGSSAVPALDQRGGCRSSAWLFSFLQNFDEKREFSTVSQFFFSLSSKASLPELVN